MTVKIDSEEEWFVTKEISEAGGKDTWVFRTFNISEAEVTEDAEADRVQTVSSVSVMVHVDDAEEISEENNLKLKVIKNIGENYICFCGFLSPDIRLVFNHVDSHRGWQEYIKPEKEEEIPRTRNVHLNPSWKEELKEKFQEKVIDRCSQDTREAWAEKRQEENMGKFTEIRNEIIRKLVDALYEVHGLVSTPSYHTLEGIVSEILADSYPYMFKESDKERREPGLTLGYGRGGALGLKNLHKQIWQKIYNKQMEERKAILANKEKSGDVEPGESLKQGNNPATYGIDSYKFYSVATEQQKENLKQTETEEDTEAREIIYSRNRAALAMEIRSSQKNISQIIRGFWRSPRHLHSHFVYVTNGVSDLRIKIALNWEKIIKSFMDYIIIKDKNNKYIPNINEVRNQVLTEYSGVAVILQVEIVRAACNLLDKCGDGRTFILKEGEDPVGEGVPYLRMRELPNR